MTVNASGIAVNVPVTFPSTLNANLDVGENLKKLVQETLYIIENTPSKVIRDAGEEMVLEIKALQEAYKQSLELTIDQVDRALKDRINQFNLVIIEMEKRNYKEVERLMAGVGQQLLSTSVFGTNYPYVRALSPYSVVTSKTEGYVVEFFGSFPQAAYNGFLPQLTLNGQTLTPSEHDNGRLAFRVSVNEAFAQSDAVSGVLTIPYSGFIKFLKGSVRYEFEIQALPKTVGSITIISSTTEMPPPIQVKKVSDLFKLNSRKKYGGKDRKMEAELSVTPGKTIIPDSCNIEWDKRSGKISYTNVKKNENRYSILAETFNNKKSDGKSGKLYFKLSCLEYAPPDPKIIDTSTPVELEWGGSKVLEFPPNKWKVIYQPFDGSPTREFAGQHLDDPYIQIKADGNIVRLSTNEAAKIKTLQSARTLKITHYEPPTTAYIKRMFSKENSCQTSVGLGLLVVGTGVLFRARRGRF